MGYLSNTTVPRKLRRFVVHLCRKEQLILLGVLFTTLYLYRGLFRTSDLNYKYPDEVSFEHGLIAHIQTDRGLIELSVNGYDDPPSRSFLKGQTNPFLKDHLQQLLACDLEHDLVDIGFGFGELSATTAKWQRQVLSIDASLDNIRHLLTTIKLGNFQKVTVLHNALFDFEKTLDYRAAEISKDIVRRSDKTGANYAVKTIFLNDLLPILKQFHKIILRLNSGDFDYEALLRGHSFFTELKVPHIIMNWEFVRVSDRVKSFKQGQIIKYLHALKYKPYSDFTKPETLLKLNEYEKWPEVVFWAKEGNLCVGREDLNKIREAYREKDNLKEWMTDFVNDRKRQKHSKPDSLGYNLFFKTLQEVKRRRNRIERKKDRLK